MRQDCGQFPVIRVPDAVPALPAPDDDRYLDRQSLGLLRDLRLRRFAQWTGPVTIVVDQTGVVTVNDEAP